MTDDWSRKRGTRGTFRGPEGAAATASNTVGNRQTQINVSPGDAVLDVVSACGCVIASSAAAKSAVQ